MAQETEVQPGKGASWRTCVSVVTRLATAAPSCLSTVTGQSGMPLCLLAKVLQNFRYSCQRSVIIVFVFISFWSGSQIDVHVCPKHILALLDFVTRGTVVAWGSVVRPSSISSGLSETHTRDTDQILWKLQIFWFFFFVFVNMGPCGNTNFKTQLLLQFSSDLTHDKWGTYTEI